ncbi:MAG: RedB protein [Myxococcales bacterium]|nr:RedB protein [Myxococcales bacterium]
MEEQNISDRTALAHGRASLAPQANSFPERGHRMELIVGAWLATALAGLLALLFYSSTPGQPSKAPAHWPASSRLSHKGSKATLVLVAHPHCSCTRASLAELARLMRRVGDYARGYVLMVRPQNFTKGWSRTDLWDQAASIAGVEVIDDQGGAEARRFGVHTSGATLLYSAHGSLLFQGGITPSRGHEGDSFGKTRIVEMLEQGRTLRSLGDVFGCALDERYAAEFILRALRLSHRGGRHAESRMFQ